MTKKERTIKVLLEASELVHEASFKFSAKKDLETVKKLSETASYLLDLGLELKDLGREL